MNLSELAVKRPVATGTILLLILLIGLVSLYQSPLDLLPDIQPPVMAVITTFPGSSPQETLELVTKPIEEGVNAVGGLTGMSSVSQENVSLVILRFDWGADVKNIRENISVRLDLLNLPDGVQRPMILEFDPTLIPIMSVAASGTDDFVQLTEWLEEVAAPRLESILGVASVQVQGGARQDLFIRTSPELMAEYEVSFDQIANVLRASLLDLPAGIIDLEDRQVRIRFLGRYAESEMLSDLIVGFQIDQEKFEEMLGREIDLNLNQLLAGQGDFLSGGGMALDVPISDIYWDDLFEFERAYMAGGILYLPVDSSLAASDEVDLDRGIRLFTASPHIDYEPENYRLAISYNSLGQIRLDLGSSFSSFSEPVRLEDIWLIDDSVWDSERIIIPLDPLSITNYGLETESISRLAERNPLIVEANSNYLLVSFHENWSTIRREPLVSIPDFGAWFTNIRGQLDRGVNDATDLLEEELFDLATAMVMGSMSPGGLNMDALGFEEDFPINPIRLSMVAEIEQDLYSPTSIARFNGQPSINLSLQKGGDANTVIVARQIRNVLDQLSEESGGTLGEIQFNTTFDQAEEIERALAELAWSLAGGAALAIIVLLLFLRNWRTTMFIGISIPAAIIATFTLLYFTNITINLMTLGGLALAAGMLVDNAIVVSENIFRRYQLGENPSDAAINGAKEVAGAITASTLTTISVFFPVVFLSGLAGQIFREFALTVACAILASLIVALTVIPLLASRSLYLRSQAEVSETGFSGPPLYLRMLHFAVNKPWWVVIGLLLFIGIGLIGFTTLGTELFPPTDESAFSINANLPPGTTLAVSNNYARDVEAILADNRDIVSFSTQVGGGGFMGLPGGGGSSNQVRIRAEVEPAATDRIEQIIEEVRAEVETLSGGAAVNVMRESLLDAAGVETTLDLTVSGNELDKVIQFTDQAVRLLKNNNNFSDVQSSLEERRPEIHIRLDQSQALQKGVTQVQVATAVRQALEGIPVSRIETDAGILSVVLGYQKSDIRTIDDIGMIGFYTPAGEYLQLEEVASISEAFGPQSIPREDQKIVGQIQMQYGDIDLGSATDLALEELETIILPEGYSIEPAGSFTIMGEALSELQLVLIVAALLVYLVMAAQFESLRHPFIIICSLPLAYVGSILALIVTGNNLSIPAMIGLVVLSGILVNDGIIMVDFINQQIRIHGLPLREAIIEGATARLRPILMTTATTCLGLLPLAMGFGEGSQLQAPMAITIIGGQITGTFLLLLAIPSIYRLITRDQVLNSSEPREGSFYAEPNDRLKNNGSKISLYKVVLRMLVVLILAVVIIILYSISG